MCWIGWLQVKRFMGTFPLDSLLLHKSLHGDRRSSIWWGGRWCGDEKCIWIYSHTYKHITYSIDKGTCVWVLEQWKKDEAKSESSSHISVLIYLPQQFWNGTRAYHRRRECGSQNGEWYFPHKFREIPQPLLHHQQSWVQDWAHGSQGSSQEYYHARGAVLEVPNVFATWLMRLAQCQCLEEDPRGLPPRSWLGWPHLVAKNPFHFERELGGDMLSRERDHLRLLLFEWLERRALLLPLLSTYLSKKKENHISLRYLNENFLIYNKNLLILKIIFTNIH